MPVLGDLIVKIKVEGEGQAVSSIQRVNQTASNTGRNFSSANVSATQLFATLARGSGNASTGLVNMGDGVKVVNNNFLDLVQTLSILGKSFNLNLTNPLKGMQSYISSLKQIKTQAFTTAGGKIVSTAGGIGAVDKIKDMSQGRGMMANIARMEQAGIPDDQIKQKVKNIRNLAKDFMKDQGQVIEFFKKNDWAGKYANLVGSGFGKLIGAYTKVTNFLGKTPFLLKQFGGDLLGFFGKLISFTGKFYAGVFSVAVPALTAIAMAASEAAANLEIMRTKMSATLMGQGMTQAQAGLASGNMMGAIKQLSEPSVYTAQQIGEASQRMEAFGLNSIKTLKTSLKLAEVFGGMPDDLEMVVRMFGRMASGDLPDIEVLSRFGISKAALNATSNKLYGKNIIDMNTKTFTGTPEEGVATIAKLIEDRYGSLDAKLAETFNAKKATLQEKFTSLLEVVGKPINEALIKIMGPLSQFIQQLIDSGAAESFGQAIAGVISAFGEPGNAESFKQFGLFLIAFLQEAAMELKKFVSGFAGFLDLLRGAALALTNIGTFGLSGFTTGTGLPEMASGLGKILNPKNYLNIPQFFGMNVFERQKEIQGKLGKKTGAATDYLGMFESDKFIKNAEEQTNQLEEIKNNTGRAADALELRKANLGGRGGPLAQLGMGINVNQAGTTAGVMKAALPPSFALLNPVNQLQKSIQMEVFRTTNQQYIRRY